MNDKRKEYLKRWREDNKEHIKNYKKEYAKTHDSSFKKLQDKYKQLQQENKKLNGAIQTYDILLKANVKENQQLKIQISVREEEYKKLEDNWNKLKVYIKTEIPEDVFIDTEWFVSILDKMQELEQGSDSNE